MIMKMMKMLLTFDGQMYKEKMRKSKANLTESLQKEGDKENFHTQKKTTGGLFDDFGIEPKEKIKKNYFKVNFLY